MVKLLLQSHSYLHAISSNQLAKDITSFQVYTCLDAHVCVLSIRTHRPIIIKM